VDGRSRAIQEAIALQTKVLNCLKTVLKVNISVQNDNNDQVNQDSIGNLNSKVIKIQTIKKVGPQ